MKRTQLAKSIAMVLAGSAMTMGAVSTASAHTMYNKFIPADSTFGTDGWVYGFDSSLPQGTRGDVHYPTPTPGFVGMGTATPNNAPFGYSGKAHLNWATQVYYVGQKLEISTSDSLYRYGFAAEIDTGAGAWQDGGGADGTGPIQGWKHQTDIGLIKSEVGAYIQLTPSVVSGTGYDIQNFGITVFTGMDTNTGNYSHHGSWNCPTGCSGNVTKAFELDDPFGTQGLTYLTHSGNVDADNPLTFWAEAGQVYSIYIGGAGVGHWRDNVASYKLDVAAVPVPAAVWFFGSALAGLVGFNRRNKTIA